MALVNLTSAPFYLIDLYVNYDCELHGTNLCDDLVRFLATNAAGCPAESLLALSVAAEPGAAIASSVPIVPPTQLQLLCLEPLLLAFQHMVDRCELTVRAHQGSPPSRLTVPSFAARRPLTCRSASATRGGRLRCLNARAPPPGPQRRRCWKHSVP